MLGFTFQRLIDHVQREFDFVFVNIDDVLVGSTGEKEHRQHFKTVFTYQLHHVKCSDDPRADALSHLAVNSEQCFTDNDYDAIAQVQQNNCLLLFIIFEMPKTSIVPLRHY